MANVAAQTPIRLRKSALSETRMPARAPRPWPGFTRVSRHPHPLNALWILYQWKFCWIVSLLCIFLDNFSIALMIFSTFFFTAEEPLQPPKISLSGTRIYRQRRTMPPHEHQICHGTVKRLPYTLRYISHAPVPTYKRLVFKTFAAAWASTTKGYPRVNEKLLT